MSDEPTPIPTFREGKNTNHFLDPTVRGLENVPTGVDPVEEARKRRALTAPPKKSKKSQKPQKRLKGQKVKKPDLMTTYEEPQDSTFLLPGVLDMDSAVPEDSNPLLAEMASSPVEVPQAQEENVHPYLDKVYPILLRHANLRTWNVIAVRSLFVSAGKWSPDIRTDIESSVRVRVMDRNWINSMLYSLDMLLSMNNASLMTLRLSPNRIAVMLCGLAGFFALHDFMGDPDTADQES